MTSQSASIIARVRWPNWKWAVLLLPSSRLQRHRMSSQLGFPCLSSRQNQLFAEPLVFLCQSPHSFFLDSFWNVTPFFLYSLTPFSNYIPDSGIPPQTRYRWYSLQVDIPLVISRKRCAPHLLSAAVGMNVKPNFSLSLSLLFWNWRLLLS